jgi:hypothetical protein
MIGMASNHAELMTLQMTARIWAGIDRGGADRDGASGLN